MHALENYVFRRDSFDTPRRDRLIRPSLFIGPQRDAAAPLLEVMAEFSASRMRVFHVMQASKRHPALWEEARRG